MIQVKICGIRDRAALDAVLTHGADFVGFNFYQPSPRHISIEQAATLASEAKAVQRVGLFVDPDDAALERTLSQVALDILQLHGREDPARVAAIRARFGLKIMKALPIATAADFAPVADFEHVADYLLFDAKPRPDDRLPGGNGRIFDWHLLAGRSFARPWFLAGGLTADNVSAAVRQSGAPGVDVSSGLESAPGKKDPALIRAFLAQIRSYSNLKGSSYETNSDCH